jgi:hypothetical protein
MTYSAKIEALIAERDALQEQIALLEGTIESRDRNIQALQGENESLRNKGFQLMQAHGELQAENERLSTELEKAQDEINCAESSLEAFSCEFEAEVFNQGFDCLGDFVQALWTASNDQRNALQSRLDAMGKGEAVGVFRTDENIGHIELMPYQGQPMVDGQAVYAAPKALAPLTDEQAISEMWKARSKWMEEAGIDTEGIQHDLPTLYAMLPYFRAGEAAHGIHAKGGQQ